MIIVQDQMKRKKVSSNKDKEIHCGVEANILDCDILVGSNTIYTIILCFRLIYLGKLWLPSSLTAVG